jgi:hypothetical protein
MRMQRLTLIALIAALATLPLPAAAQDGSSTEGSVEIGGRVVDTEDNQNLAAEYLTTDDNAALGLDFSTVGSWGSLMIDGAWVDSDENDATLDFDIARMVRSHTSYTKFIHRLGHDPMTNLESTSTNDKAVWYTDLDPSAEYGYSYFDLQHRTEIQIPALRALTLAVEAREQKRDGHVQSYSVSHCDTCHMYSRSHRMDERTTDGTLEAKVDWFSGHAIARLTSRELRHGTPSVTTTYDQARHPALQAPIFGNRLQYDADVGPVEADRWANIDKDTAKLQFFFRDVLGFAVNAAGVWSETENTFTGYKADYTGYVLNGARRLGDNWRLRWRGRVYSIENDDVYIDTIERVTVAGPHAGRTYEEIYGKNFDRTRYSALDRDVFESKLDASWRLGKTLGTLRFNWDYSTIDRDNYEVLPGETETTENILGVSWRLRPAKGFKLWAAYRHGEIDNPFMLINGACSTMVSDRYPNPWDPATPDYDDFQNERIAETTSSPSSYDQLKLNGSLSLGTNAMLAASYQWWDGSNSDGDLTDWSRTNQNATITLWSAPSTSWDWYVAYAWQDSALDAPACIPIFDG